MPVQDAATEPFISVIIVCYNYAHLLPRTLDSCARQTFRDFELVCVDNASEDNTTEVFEQFAAEHPNIETKIITLDKNLGAVHGRNAGLDNATGKYIMFNDADDWMDDDCLEVLAARAEETDEDQIYGQLREVMPDGKVFRERTFVKHPSEHPAIVLQCAIFKRALIEEHHLRMEEGLAFTDDWYFNLKFSLFSKKIGVVHKTLYNYYFNSLSATATKELFGGDMVKWKCQVKICADAAQKTDDGHFKDEIEYHLIIDYYTRVLQAFMWLDKDAGREAYARLRGAVTASFPNYMKNPLFHPFGNGFHVPANFCRLILRELERMGWMTVMQKAVKLFKHTKIIRF